MYPSLADIKGASTKKTTTKDQPTTIPIVDCFKYAIKNEGTANVIIDDSYLLLPGYTDSADNIVPMNGEIKIDFDGTGTKKVRVSLITAIRG